jgi:hypothetical protein
MAMNAIISILAWALGLFGSHSIDSRPVNNHGRNQVTPHEVNVSTNGVHIMNGNPRTVVALEDTHFRPM